MAQGRGRSRPSAPRSASSSRPLSGCKEWVAGEPLRTLAQEISSSPMGDLRISFPNPCGESWDAMQPSGCNRFCATCSETIYDLSELTSQEAETLLREPGKHCVRARVGPDGELVLRPSRSGSSRKILVAIGASIGLLTSACETSPRVPAPTGLIVGKVDPRSGVKSVKAVSDNGRSYRTKVLSDGSFRFRPLPYGSYSLQFNDDCSTWDGDRVTLQESEHSVKAPQNMGICVVVGMAEFEDDRA